MFAAIKLIESGLSVALIDKGGNFYTRANTKEKDMIGFGGAAMRYDANLDYSDGIPKESKLGERVFGDREIATKYIKDVYDKLESFGLKRDVFQTVIKPKSNNADDFLKVIDRGLVSIGEKTSAEVLRKIYDHLVSKGLLFLEFAEVVDITKQREEFIVDIIVHGNERKTIQAKNVVLATGKLSVNQSRLIFDKLGVRYKKCNTIDVGIRVETNKKTTDQITLGCINPKIILERNGVVTKTFCWCPGGKVISYEFEGVCVVDGQHCHDNPTEQTNFGIVTSIELPPNVDGTDFGVSYIKTFGEFTNKKPGVQILGDFINGKASSRQDVENNPVAPTTADYSLVNLGAVSIFDLKSEALNLIENLNKIYPQAIGPESLVYGPVLERIFPKVELTQNMESSVTGFFIIGDISGKAIGIITGAAMGMKVADHLIEKIN